MQCNFWFGSPHDRHEVKSKAVPLFAKANVSIGVSSFQDKVHNLRVFDGSENGVGILVGEELVDWLKRIGIGDKLEEVELSAPWTIVRVDGIVRHKSRVRKGKYKEKTAATIYWKLSSAKSSSTVLESAVLRTR